MADKRKLQGEIDRCLKQVAERVEIFEELWDKVQAASNANQKEKYEADLKKEIKKLQRLRDQIKTWSSSPDAKTQKQVLADTKRLIEVQMERFKVIERETKTKAYSKEGLAAKVDPAQKERQEARDWLNDCVEQLTIQIDKLEAEVETINKAKKKTAKEQKRLEELRKFIERNKFHIDRIEMLIRLLDNDSIEHDRVTAIREDIDVYISDNQEPEFQENESLYEEFEDMMSAMRAEDGMDSDDEGGGERTRHDTEETKDDDGAAAKAKSKEKEREREREKEKEKEREREKEKEKETPKKAERREERAPPATPPLKAAVPRALNINFAAAVAAPTSVPTAPLPPPSATTSLPPPSLSSLPSATLPSRPTPPPSLTLSPSLSSSSSVPVLPSPLPPPTTTLPPSLPIASSSLPVPPLPSAALPPSATPPPLSSSLPPSLPPPSSSQPPLPFSSLPPTTPLVAPPSLSSAPLPTLPSALPPASLLSSPPLSSLPPPAPASSLPPTLTSSPLAPSSLPLPPSLPSDGGLSSLPSSLAALELSSRLLPETSERPPYTPKNPVRAPPYYPPIPLPIFDRPSFYSEVSLDSLFFLFYYCPNTPLQYHATRELHRQAWRFHRDLQMWILRQGEPKAVGPDYEQGAYRAFDAESWTHKSKGDFVFEHRCMEETDLP